MSVLKGHVFYVITKSEELDSADRIHLNYCCVFVACFHMTGTCFKHHDETNLRNEQINNGRAIEVESFVFVLTL